MDNPRSALIQAIYGQESGYGQADTSKPNYAGARGPMQVTLATFTGMKDKGMIPQEWDHANPEHSTQAGVTLINYLADKYADDPAKVAAAYYAGEKAVRPDGSIAFYKDIKNPGAPSTHEYVKQVLARMGTVQAEAPAPLPRGPVSLTALMPDIQPKGRGKVPKEQVFVSDLPDTTPVVGSDPTQVTLDARRAEAVHQKAAQEVADTGILESARAQFMHNGILGGLAKLAVKPAFEDTPGFVVDPKLLAGKTADEALALRGAGSQAEVDWLLFDQEDAQEQARKAGLRGVGTALVGGFISGLPEGYLTGLGAFKAFQLAGVGATALAAEGRMGAAWASAALENVGGNVLGTAAADALGQHVGADDYAMAVAMGMAVTPLTAFGSIAEAGKLHADAAAQRIAKEAALKIEAKKAEAIKNLGENATPEQIIAEMQRLDAKEIQGTLSTGSGRKLIDSAVDETGAPDLPKIEGAQEMSAAEVADKTGLKPAFANADTGGTVAKAGHIKDDPSLTRLQTAEDVDAGWNNYDASSILNGKSTTPRAAVKAEYGLDIQELHNRPVGVYAEVNKAGKTADDKVKAAVDFVHKHFLNNTRIIIQNGDGDLGLGTLGDHWYVGNNTHIIRVREGRVQSAFHELGHAILKSQWNRVTKGKVREGFLAWHKEWLDNYTKSRPDIGQYGGATRTALERGAVVSNYTDQYKRPNPEGFQASLFDIVLGVVNKVTGAVQRMAGNDGLHAAQKYIPSLDEFGAEQFAKYVEAAAAEVLPWKPNSIPQEVMEFFRLSWIKLIGLFNLAKKEGYLTPDERAVDFFEAVRKVNKAEATKERISKVGKEYPQRRNANPVAIEGSSSMATQAAPSWRDDPIATKYGLDLLPDGTPHEAAEAKAIVDLYRRADNPEAPWNNIDPVKVSSLTDNSLFNVASTSLLMLKSDNPVVRMVAAELLESPAGAAGRRSTASLATFLNVRKYTGALVPDVQDAYKVWRSQHGGSLMEDLWGGKKWEQFNRLVAEEIEGRKSGAPSQSHPAVVAAANAAEQAFERMRVAQVQAKTIGWGGLPETSVGYMPHKLSPERVRNMTLAQRQTLHAALVDQFVQIEGFDISFSAQLASKYIDRVNTRATGGFDSSMNVHDIGAADVVEDALTAMGMSKAEVHAQMQKFMRGSAGHVKGRLKLDLLARDENGFRLMDLYETDILKLVRSQANRVAGEVALADYGVMGKPGLKLLKQAMTQGSETTRAQNHELTAFDQVAAEFMGDPFGTSNSKWADRVLMTTSLARLGGMGFTQFAEAINAIWHIGAAKALGTIPAMPRLRAEAKALARGEHVDNGILGSIEKYSGVEFGADSYKIKFPFDNGSLEHLTYGKDSITFADRVLRGATHLQGKLSLWRSIHAAQTRGMAEQIVAKAARFLQEGGEDKALADMGITPELAAKLRADIGQAATFEGGRLKEFDITKFTDAEAANAFVQAVHRGASQIIQGTYIGETGKWAHDGLLRILTQFRTFSITSIEKQWTRQRGNYGTAGALGILLGSMSMAAPIYMSRVAANSIGREDRDEYLARQLSPTQIARASLNYVAVSGLSGDLLDALTALTGTGELTGGRSGAQSQFVGNVVAPAAGLADDLWRAMQNTKEGTDPHDLLKNLPFSKLPVLQQAINALD